MIQKQLLSLKRDATSELKLDVGKIIDVFERNLQANTTNQEPLVSMTACGILSDIFASSNDSQNATYAYQRLS